MNFLFCFLGLGCGDDIVPLGREQFAEKEQRVQFVVNHQDFGRFLFEPPQLIFRKWSHLLMRRRSEMQGCTEEFRFAGPDVTHREKSENKKSKISLRGACGAKQWDVDDCTS